MKLGITSFAYRWAVSREFSINCFSETKPLDVHGLLDKVSTFGLEVLQVSENVSLDLSDKNCRKLGKLAKNKKINLEFGIRGIDSSSINKFIKIATMTGAQLLNVYPTKKESVETLVERIRSFLPLLENCGLTLSLENSSLCLYDCNQLAKIFERVNDPLVGACIDTLNSTGLLEKPLETVSVLAPYAVCLHLKDYRIERKNVSGFSIYGVPLGLVCLMLRLYLT